MDWGNDGGNMHIFDTTELAPNATAELVVYLALAGSLEEARRYGVLGAKG
jgi:hypothetical protein